MDRQGFSSFLLLLLLIAVAVASEPESSRQNRVAGRSEQDATLRAAPILITSRTNTTTISTDTLPEDAGTRERPPESREGYEDEQESTPKEGEEDEEDEEYYEGEEEDEYEDELKAVAESHEAMSRDDTRNSNVSSPGAISSLIGERSPGAKSFDSHEVITVNDSDEDIASNEAITDEVVNKYDEEVAELLKYKKERNSNLHGSDKTKMKRVPTVKKELSTQKEILIASNETQVPKSLMPSEDTLNRLNEEIEPIRRRNAGSDGRSAMEKSERVRSETTGSESNRYSDFESVNPRKRKREDVPPEKLNPYLSQVFSNEEYQNYLIHHLKIENKEAVQQIVGYFEKLYKIPKYRECIQSLILYFINEQLSPANSPDISKRTYTPTFSLSTTTPSSDENTRKSRKKLKKKKKKPRRRATTTTMTPSPAVPQLLTTTETSWQTTPVQWRLVAERLFGPPWQKELQEDPKDAPKVRYSVPSKPRTLPTILDLIEQNKAGSDSKTFSSERKPVLPDPGREMTGERLLRFGKVNTHPPGHLQGHREFANVYDQPEEPDHPPDYDVAEAYQRLRFNQLPPSPREFLRKNEDDYQNDFAMQSENFARNREYEPSSRDFPISKSWPDIPYQYGRPWKTEERPSSPTSDGKWSWRQSQSDYWPRRNKFLQPERNYWSPMGNEDEMEEESEADKIWQQHQQRLPMHSWDRERSSGWPLEKSLKMPPNWQQTERSMKLYDRGQSNGAWEKSKNRSELNKSSTKPESKDKVVLPQITMKTWNSLTSDPATWPYKLPGAKPWPKDENGKSYNPNADLVKKLGLDKQNDMTWSKEEGGNSNPGRETKSEKQNKIFPASQSSKEEVSVDSKYRSTDEKSNYSNYKTRSSLKEWKPRESENPQNDEASVWDGKYESRKNSWQSEDSLPKIQSVGAWVMGADQSTWKPYPIKPIDSLDDNSPASRRWSNGRSGVGEYRWPNKEARWTEKMNDSWLERGNVGSWPGKQSASGSWPGKPGKSSPWYAKAKEEPWASKSSDADSWKVKGDPSWLIKPNESSSWSSRILDNNSWALKESGSPWPIKSNESWTAKGNGESSKFNNGDTWPTKIKDDDAWPSKSIDASWKANEGNSWPRKPTERNNWNTKSGDIRSWQQKMNEEWNYGKGGSTGTWPTKWKQFAYHRVTAMPISKPGTTADAASSKSKNAFVAVSAVSSAQNSGSDQWRKSDEDGRSENARSEEPERGSNQIQVGLERPIYAWKKDPGLRATSVAKGNVTDPLENQLEALRQIDFWTYKENEGEKISTTRNATMQTPSITPSNSTTTAHRRSGMATKDNGGGSLETNRQTIPMK